MSSSAYQYLVYHGSSVCLPLSIEVEKSFWDVDKPWIAGAFILGLVVGIVIAVLCCKFICIKSYLKKKNQDAENAICQQQGIPNHMKGIALHGIEPDDDDDYGPQKKRSVTKKFVKISEKRKMSSKKKGKIINEIKIEQTSKITTEMRQVHFLLQHIVVSTDRGMADALLQTNSESTNSELLSQEIADVTSLEVELQTQKLLSFMESINSLLALLVSKEKLSEDKAKSIKTEIEDNIKGYITAQEDEDGTVDDSHHGHRLEQSMLKEEEENFRRELNKTGTMSDDEVEAVMGKLIEDMAKVERILGEESMRQARALEERLAKRRLLAEKSQKNVKLEEDEINTRIGNHEKNLEKLVTDKTLHEKQRDDIMRTYEEDLRRVQENHEDEVMRHKQSLHEQLRKRREERLKKLTDKQNKEQEELLEKTTKQTSEMGTGTGPDFIEGYHRLAQQQREERDHVIDELDLQETEEMDRVRLELESSRTQALDQEEDKLLENLNTKAQLSEAEANRIMKLHQQEMDEFDRRRDAEKQKINAKMAEKLAKRKQKIEEEENKQIAEQQIIKEQQDTTIKKVLDSQVELTEQARQKIMMEHDKNTQALNNQLAISKLKQQKTLEQKLSQRKAKVAELKRKQQRMKENEKDKLQEQLQKQIEEEELKIEKDHQVALEDLRKRLAEETEEALKLQDAQLGVLIGRLEVGQARRQAIIQKQDKTIKELQEKLGDKVAEKGGQKDGTSQILKQHYNQMEHLNEQLQSNKERQEQMLKEKLEQKRLQKEREIEETMEKEQEDQVNDQNSRGAGLASHILSKTLLDRKHKKALEELEHDFKVELTKQKDEINKQLEQDMDTELQNQKKSFLAQLAAVSNLSKSDLNGIVDAAVTDTGADDKTAKKLAKNLRLEVKRAKSTLGMEGQDNEAYADEDRKRNHLGAYNLS